MPPPLPSPSPSPSPAPVAPEAPTAESNTAGAAVPVPTPWLRIFMVAAPPALLSLWLSVPLFQPAVQTLSGRLEVARVCLVKCADVIRLGDVHLGCQVDLLGVPYSCRARLLQPGEVTLRYAAMPSVASVLGLAPTAGTLLRLEREGQVVYARSLAQQVWASLAGGWVFHAVYWPIAGLVIGFWPGSRFARRVTWADWPRRPPPAPPAGREPPK